MDDAVRAQLTGTSERDVEFLDQVTEIIPMLADLSRADVLLGALRDDDHVLIVAHAKPHSIAPVHRDSLMGHSLTKRDVKTLFRALESHNFARGMRESPLVIGESETAPAPVVQEVYPIETQVGHAIGVMLIETNLLESERLKRRSDVFQRVLKMFQQNAIRGEPKGMENLSPFGEHDGIMIVDGEGVIRYMSGIVTNMYRNIGYGEQLVGKPLSYLETQDDKLVRQGIYTRRCIQVAMEERRRSWVKKVIPIYRFDQPSLYSPIDQNPLLAFLLIHDDTEAQQRLRELLVKATIDFHSCFISYSSKDNRFCERLYADLQANAVPVWYFPEDAKWGEPLWGEIDRSIKTYDKLIVICSKHSLTSSPVLREIERVLNREDKERKNVLFPITIDRYIFDEWEHPRKDDVLAKVVGTDFVGWNRDADKYDKAFKKLLKALKAD